MNGRNPSRLIALPEDPRCGSALFLTPMLLRSEFPGAEGRALLPLGGLKERNPLRFPFCMVEFSAFLELFISLPPNAPAFERRAVDSPLMRPPAGIPLT